MACLSLLGGSGAALGQIVITEIMQNPSAANDSDGEWFELHNAGGASVDIQNWVIEEADGNPSHTINQSVSIAAGAYVILAENGTSASNGGVSAVYDYPSSFILNNSSDSIVLKNASGTEVDRVEYDNGATFPDPNGASMALKAVNLDNSVGANWCTSPNVWSGSAGDRGSPGAANDCPGFEPPDSPPAMAFVGPIYELQGSGSASPMVGMTVTTNDNVVTAVGAGGFFIQTPTAASDNDVDTSDGIFVLYDGATTINVGDQVDVTGQVEEFFGFTRIDATGDDASATIDASNQPLPAPVEFNATVPSSDPASPSCALEFECYEGMLITIPLGTVSGPSQSFGSDPVAEMYVTSTSSRAFREKGAEYPGVPGRPDLPVWDGNPELFELDPDKLGLPNASWLPWTTFTATGVLGFEFGGYEMWPVALEALEEGPPLPRAARPRRAGEVTVASINVLNLNDADASYGTKRNKLSLYVRDVLRSPDIIAVQEAFTLQALRGLAAEIFRDDPDVVYTAYLQEGNREPDGIDVGFLVRSGVRVNGFRQLGRAETYVNPDNGERLLLHDRPPLLLDASVSGLDFSVIVVHNRSLINFAQERVQVKRLEQAQSVARMAQARQDRKLIVVGDFNAYQFTDGYVDVMGQIQGSVNPAENLMPGPDLVSPNLINLIDRVPAAQRYSYSFENTAQVLDHALVNRQMESSVVDIQYARANVDARAVASNSLDPDSPLRSSDHDGFVVYLAAPGRPGPVPEPLRFRLSLASSGEIVSESLVRFRVVVRNEGADDAPNVGVVSSLTAATGAFETETSGCADDPRGMPVCGLGGIEVGDSDTFTIDVAIDAASPNLLTWSGAVGDADDRRTLESPVVVVLPLGRPEAPSSLEAAALNETEVELRWRDNADRETGFDVFLQGPGDSKPRLIGSAPADTTSMVVNELVPGITYRFAVEARNGALRSGRTPLASATTWTADAARCDEDTALCVGAFQVEVEWQDGRGRAGSGFAERLTGAAGDFWFFQPTNIELVVKVLNGCSINGHYWVYAAGLTDVEVAMTVRDLRTGFERQWTNPLGTRFRPISATQAFVCGDEASANSQSRVALSGAPGNRFGDLYAAALNIADGSVSASGACAANDAALCLLDGRFEVRSDWEAGGRNGAAAALPRTTDTGMFWFFGADNVELAVKVLDGCRVNGHRWVLMGGLTDVGVEVTVTDGESGRARTYRNPEGTPFATQFDVTAFACEGAGQGLAVPAGVRGDG